MRTLHAHTHEIDDVETAIEEILAQINVKDNLRAHSVGIIACHYEFIGSGVYRAITEALPFDIVGATSMKQALADETDTLLLTLMVLTSDEDSFSVALTGSMRGSLEEARIERSYREAAARLPSPPSLLLSYVPLLNLIGHACDDFVEEIARISGSVPCFGTMPIDDTEDYEFCLVLHNGEQYADRAAMILIQSTAIPQFFIATISPEKILDKTALVTKSSRNILQEVNGRPAREYFAGMGLATAANTQYAMSALPFLFDYGDGTPRASKVFFSTTQEGYSVCAGLIPEGTTLSIGMFDRADVLRTTGNALDSALAGAQDASFMLIYSCITRCMSLGSNSMAELRLAQSKIGDKLPFMMAYSGGEICPIQISSATSVNRFHNNALIICVM